MDDGLSQSRASHTVARPTRTRLRPARHPVDRGRRRAGRPGDGDRSGAARHRGRCCSTTTTSCRPARARSASPSARWRSSTGSACGEPHGRQGRVVERRQGLLPATSWSTASTCCPKPGHQRPGLHQPAAVLRRGLSRRARARAAEPRACAGRTRSSALDAARRSTSKLDGRDARRTVPAEPATVWSPATARAVAVRSMMGLESKGRVFRDRFLIADVKMKARLSRPSAGSGSTRRSIRNQACCCTGSPTTSGASTSSSAGTPTRRRRRSRSA